MLQSIVATLLVVGCALYATWTLLPGPGGVASPPRC